MPIIAGVMYHAQPGRAEAHGRPSLLPAVPEWTTGVTYPDEFNTGIGVVRAAPSVDNPAQVINSDVYLSNGQTLVDKVINGRVFGGPGVTATLENCYVRGPLIAPATPRNLVYTTGSAKITLRYCLVKPQVRWWWTGVGDKNYRLERTKVVDCVDPLGCFSLPADPDPAVHIEIIESWLYDFARLAPDFGGSRTETHNDGIQLQGNVGPADDVLIDGTRIDAYHSKTYGDPPTTTAQHKQISAIMATPNQRDRICLTVRRSWMSGGVYTVNATYNGNTNSVLVMEDVKYEKPRSGGPAAPIGIYTGLTNRTLTGQTYLIDGSPVTPIITVV